MPAFVCGFRQVLSVVRFSYVSATRRKEQSVPVRIERHKDAPFRLYVESVWRPQQRIFNGTDAASADRVADDGGIVSAVFLYKADVRPSERALPVSQRNGTWTGARRQDT